MDHERFITLVAQGAGTDREGAERAMRATLQTLAERVVREELRQIAAMLAPEVAPWLASPNAAAEPFDVDEFVRRVAEREGEGVDLDTAERHARAVLAAFGQAVDPGEFANMAAQLSKDYAPLLPRGRDVHVLPADDFVLRVAELADLEPDAAVRATEAVLETLAERIAAGEVEDLISRLAVGLHPPLKRGEQRRPEATAMPVEEFLRRIAEREGVSVREEPEHARAVFTTLREAVGDEEYFDVTVQLPDDYQAVLAR
jgi:uncharacterized protein (DUF2267 family)